MDRSLYTDREGNAKAARELDEAKGRVEDSKKAAFMATVTSIARDRGMPVESVIRIVQNRMVRSGTTEAEALQRTFGVKPGDVIKSMGELYGEYRETLGKTDHIKED